MRQVWLLFVCFGEKDWQHLILRSGEDAETVREALSECRLVTDVVVSAIDLKELERKSRQNAPG